ncbi:hypothetical protein HG15A2_29240 [Adhaeretor mobilis]|uniref:Uncharacterized protein n=1 Tax=Adhaeretor mobilis TaxID=1930276 RepID=A0A517MXI0_9BACT|nr:hypothetical protein HG15A2_29240 [Adhaeretor mobilis]
MCVCKAVFSNFYGIMKWDTPRSNKPDQRAPKSHNSFVEFQITRSLLGKCPLEELIPQDNSRGQQEFMTLVFFTADTGLV